LRGRAVLIDLVRDHVVMITNFQTELFQEKIALSGTLENDRTVLYKTKSLDGGKPYTNPRTNPNPKLTLILTLFTCFMHFPSTVP